MKDHTLEGRIVYTPSGDSLSSFIETLEKAAEGLTDVKIETVDEYELEIYGWRPMTEKEKEQAKKKRARERAAAKKRKQKKEEQERQEYERLKQRFEPEKTDPS